MLCECREDAAGSVLSLLSAGPLCYSRPSFGGHSLVCARLLEGRCGSLLQ